jgi:hypothetical protein
VSYCFFNSGGQASETVVCFATAVVAFTLYNRKNWATLQRIGAEKISSELRCDTDLAGEQPAYAGELLARLKNWTIAGLAGLNLGRF